MTELKDPERHIGPFLVERSDEQLSLTLQNQGTLTLHIRALFGFSAASILVLGILAMLKSAQTGVTDQGDFFVPSKNHFAFLWLVSTVGMLIGIPLLVAQVYKSPVTFRFNARNGAIYRNNELITRFSRVEFVKLHEFRDPDGRFLYALSLVHTAGLELLIYEVYEESLAGNLAREISTFLHRPIRWR